MDKENITAITKIGELLRQTAIDWNEVLKEIITGFDCTTGTLHFLEGQTAILHLKAQIGIPDFLLPKLSEIVVGKGMAGIAAERREPVEMCNLQTDNSGVARPAAKETKVEGSIAVPLILNDELYGTLGIAKPVPYDFTTQEKNDLLLIAKKICHYVN